jgi:hypothetical protein
VGRSRDNHSGLAHICSISHIPFSACRLDLTEEGGVKAAGSSVDFAFPPELADALRRLYHLRRGPLVSPGPIQSMDDRATIRSLFIRLPLGDCLCMMAPSLWSSGPLAASADIVPSQEVVPPETLALWENVSSTAQFPHGVLRCDL